MTNEILTGRVDIQDGVTSLIDDSTSLSLRSLADALMVPPLHCLMLQLTMCRLKIWRCYHVWERSIRIILLPLSLLTVEVGECYLAQ